MQNKKNIEQLTSLFYKELSKEEIEKEYYDNKESLFLKLCSKNKFNIRFKYKKTIKDIFNKKDLPIFYDYFKYYKNGAFVSNYNYLSLIITIVSFILTMFSSFHFSIKENLLYFFIYIGIVVIGGILITLYEYHIELRKTRNAPVTKNKDYNKIIETYNSFFEYINANKKT